MSGMRWYLRGRVGRHLGWVLPLGNTRPLSRRPRRPLSGSQRVAYWFAVASVAALLTVVCTGLLGGH